MVEALTEVKGSSVVSSNPTSSAFSSLSRGGGMASFPPMRDPQFLSARLRELATQIYETETEDPALVQDLQRLSTQDLIERVNTCEAQLMRLSEEEARELHRGRNLNILDPTNTSPSEY